MTKRVKNAIIIWAAIGVSALLLFIAFFVHQYVAIYPDHVRGDVLFVNIEDYYVYPDLNSALTDTKTEDGQPVPLKDVLSKLLDQDDLVYLKDSMAGICFDKKYTEEESPLNKSNDRLVYYIENGYYIAKTIPELNG